MSPAHNLVCNTEGLTCLTASLSNLKSSGDGICPAFILYHMTGMPLGLEQHGLLYGSHREDMPSHPDIHLKLAYL